MFGPVDVLILAREELRSEVIEEIATREIAAAPTPRPERGGGGANDTTREAHS